MNPALTRWSRGPAFAALVASVAIGAHAQGKPVALATIQQPSAGMTLRAHPAGTWEPVTSETKIPQGGAIKTGTGEAVVVLTDGTRLEIQPGTTLQFHASTEINLDPGPSTRVARVDIKDGAFRVAIPAGGRPLLAMASKDLFVAFRPGAGRARITAAGMIAASDSGGAKVAASGRWTSLQAGQYQILRTQGAQEGPKPLPARASFVAEPCHASASKACAIAVVSGDGRAQLGARWGAAAAGQRWWVDLIRDRENGEVIKHLELAADRPQFLSEPLAVGAYWLSVRAATAEGIDGERVLRPMRVVRLLPDLGVTWIAREQLLVFPPGRKVKVDGTSGVQVAWIGQQFVAVPPTLEHDGEANRQVRWRVEGDSMDDTVITLEKSALRADVELTPKTARWPKDPIQIMVKVTDPKRRVDPRTIHPRLSVKVNDTPFQLGLTRAGDSWRGEIPPRNGSGPWVIRVEALDADDNVLGRGLLNVVGKASSSPGLW
ncbi:MAG: hypothetical protein HY898_20820 [Deltaproteobacteria bacterium]|nr:hypothetical protein [Deltaproteobacteria bacterium]